MSSNVEKNPKDRLDRVGKHAVQAFIDHDTFREFKILAASQLKTNDVLINEALALLFEKYERPVPAGIKQKLGKPELK